MHFWARSAAHFLLITALSPLALAQQPVQVPPPKASTEQLPLQDLRLFTKVFDHIRTAYVNDISDSQLLENAIRGMLSELDPHSTFLDADSYGDLQINTKGEFGGLGIEVSSEDGFVKVVSPIDDTPAQKAGVQAGDLIIQLDKKNLQGLPLNEAVQLMRGPTGSAVVLTIVRKGVEKPFDITITRDIITVASVRSEIFEDDYAYVRIAQFQAKTGQDFSNKLKQLRQQAPHLKGVIMDLRNNPGGVLQASVNVVDALLEEGLIVYTQGRLDNTSQQHLATPGDDSNGLPVVVLINDGSASASEIVAGALQDQGRAVIMGTRSFGKGSVQTVIPITQEKAIKLTTALYFTPSGRSIQAQGIQPDIIVEPAQVTTIKTRSKRAEADLSGHIQNANGGNDITSKDKSNSELDPRLMKDNQLYAALNLLKGLQVFDQKLQKSAILEKPIAAKGTP